jgi:hypothetical protein
MPGETVARVWDSLLYEGPKVIYRVALAVLKTHQRLILKKDNAGGWAGEEGGLPGRSRGGGRGLRGEGASAAPGCRLCRSTCRKLLGTQTHRPSSRARRPAEQPQPRPATTLAHPAATTPRHPSAGDILKVTKDATQRMHDRERLVQCAFKDIGPLKMVTIKDLRSQHQVRRRRRAGRARARRQRQRWRAAAGAVPGAGAACAGLKSCLAACRPAGACPATPAPACAPSDSGGVDAARARGQPAAAGPALRHQRRPEEAG